MESYNKKTSIVVKLVNSIAWVLPIIIKALFEIVYIIKYYPLFGYLGAKYSPNMDKLLISWIPIIAFLLIWKKKPHSKLYGVFNLLFYISMIPSCSIYWLKNENSRCFVFIIIYWSVWYITTLLYDRNGHSRREYLEFHDDYNFKKNALYSIVYILIAIIVLYSSFRYGGMRLFIRLNDVYSYRLAEDNRMNSMLSYLFSWCTNFFLPFFLATHFVNKRWSFFIADTFLLLLCYGIYGNKSMLFSIALVAGLILLRRMNGLKYAETMIGGFIVIYLIISIFTSNGMFIALGDRILEGPAAGHYNYFDFFSQPNHPILLFRESFLRFLEKSPYNETVSRIIGSSAKYYSGAYNNMNNGLFSVAFAELGYLGVVLQPIIIVSTLHYCLKIMKSCDDLVQYTLLVMFSLYLQSTSYTSWLVTGGLFIGMSFIYMCRRVIIPKTVIRIKFSK